MLVMPRMDPARGRKVFTEKGCVACHSINGVGGDDAPPLDATLMNPFEFAAKMWRGAEAMIILQHDELGEQIELTGQDLADIIAFVHSHEEQAKFAGRLRISQDHFGLPARVSQAHFRQSADCL